MPIQVTKVIERSTRLLRSARSVSAPPPLAEVGVKLVLRHGGLQLSKPTPPDQRPAAARNTPPGLPPAAPAGLEECVAGLPAVEGGGGGPGAVVLGGPQGDQGEHVLHCRGAGHQEDEECQEAHGLVSVRGATEGSGQAPWTECNGGGRRGPVHPGAQPAGGSCHPAGGGQAGEQEAGGGGNTHCYLSAVWWGLQSTETGHRKCLSSVDVGLVARAVRQLDQGSPLAGLVTHTGVRVCLLWTLS